MRYVYISNQGGKPLFIGMNRAKMIARRADQRDQLTLLAALGTGLPRVHTHHQQLVHSRHRYYHEQFEEFKPKGVVPHFAQASGCGIRETLRRVRQNERRRAA